MMLLAVAGVKLLDRKLMPSRFLSMVSPAMLGRCEGPGFSVEVSRERIRLGEVMVARDDASSAMLDSRLSDLVDWAGESENVRVGCRSDFGRQTSPPVSLVLVSRDLSLLGTHHELALPMEDFLVGDTT